MAVKKGKIDFKKVATDALIGGGAGVAAHVVAEAVDLQDPSIMDYGLMAAGVILPEIVKSPAVDTAGGALLAVGAYRLAERNNVAGKLGFNSVAPATSGLPGTHVIGAGGWVPTRNVYAGNADGEKKNPGQVVQ